MDEKALTLLKNKLAPQKKADKEWYLSLLDGAHQTEYEQDRLRATLAMLKVAYVSHYRKKIASAQAAREEIKARKDYSAEDYRALIEINAVIAEQTKKLNAYKCFFSEPYFARMDVVDDKEGYNSYYIGKKGDLKLSIVDWRAPLAVRYYQKSRVDFTINEYEYHTVLRRALSVKNGALIDYKNEYLSVGNELTPEEIAGRDEEILFDPYLRSIIQSRKEDAGIRDIIRTIQEQQFEIITLPERDSFVLQGCAGSGKTMILLHRLSYLMYNNENLLPRDVLVITPSDSFNEFIDELTSVLELQKVKTVTLLSYYFRVLENEGIDLKGRLSEQKEKPEYLKELYSDGFMRETDAKILSLYRDIYGLFTGRECREVAEELLKTSRERSKLYTKIKNASVRVRRAVLGEMREKENGGFGFTKPFRGLMSAFADAEDFLVFVLEEEERTPDYFFRQFLRFYQSAHLAANKAEEVFSRAEHDLGALSETVEKEIVDLRRYRLRRADGEVFTYADRIARREELLGEIASIQHTVGEMKDGLGLFSDFFAVLKSAKACSELGKCENGADIARWLYRETVKRLKKKYDMNGLYPSDGYAVCYLLAAAGRQLTPRYGLVFVDEGQDISSAEYALLKKINAGAAFNVFGDLRQNITPWRGVKSWEAAGDAVYTLNRNYRNTNEIVEFVTKNLGVEMSAIGLHGKPVEEIPVKKLNAFFKDKQGLKAVIAREEYLPLFKKRGFRLLSEHGKISRSQVNVMSVYESKGLEFTAVAVFDKAMTGNEKYIAYTRALSDLVTVRD